MSKYDVTIDRHLYIGGSDIKTIMNLDSFKTRYQLLLEKAQLVNVEEVDNEYTRDGHINEDLIRDYYNKTIFKDDPLEETQTFSEDKVYRYNADGQNTQIVWECKRVGENTYNAINSPKDKECKKYLVQLLKGMELNYKEKGLLTISLRNGNFDESKVNELKEFEIDINDYKELLGEINEAVEQFRKDLEKIKANPFLTEEDLVPQDLSKIAHEVITLENQLKNYDIIKKQYEDLRTILHEEMTKAGKKNWEMPNGTLITNVLDGEDTIKKVFDEKKFKEENQEQYEKYLIDKVTKGKKGYVKITYREKENNEI